MAAPVEVGSIEQGVAAGHPACGCAVTPADESALVAVLVERARRAVDVHAQPHLGIDGAPEEHRFLDLAGARAAEVLGDGGGLPVRASAK
jgi:hypothetical protein